MLSPPTYKPAIPFKAQKSDKRAHIGAGTIDTVDLFTTLDGFAAPKAGTWGGYWGKESDAWLEHRRRQFHVDL